MEKDFPAQFNQAIDDYSKGNMFGVSNIPAHSHTGVDSNPVDYKNLANKTRFILYRILDPTTNTTVTSSLGGDFVMPFSGIVTSVGATVDTAGTTGVTTVDVKNNATSILSVKITIDSTEKTSRTATTDPVINGTKQNFSVGDVFTFDVTTISTTAAKGLTVYVDVIQVI